MPGIILCIDDNLIALKTRKLVLESAGHRVFTAGDAPEAREVFRSQAIELVIVDYFLSEGMTGTDLAAELKALRPGTRFILLSGTVEKPEGLEHVDAFLHKSDGPEALLQTVLQFDGHRAD